MRFAPLFSALALSFIATAATAEVTVSDPWARATVPGQKAGGVFMELKSSEPAALVGAASPAAGVVEIHEMKMEGDVMRMRPIPRLALPAGTPVRLQPGGYHVMLSDLKAPLKKGDQIPVTLRFEVGGKVQEHEVEAEVRDMSAGAMGGMKGKH